MGTSTVEYMTIAQTAAGGPDCGLNVDFVLGALRRRFNSTLPVIPYDGVILGWAPTNRQVVWKVKLDLS